MRVAGGMARLLPVVMLLLLVTASCERPPESRHAVIKGPFRQSVIETGELQAVNSSVVTIPRLNYMYGFNYKLIELAEHGSEVRKGDPVVTIDASSVERAVSDSRERLDNELAAMNKLRVNQRNSNQELLAQLRNVQATYDRKRLDLERSGFGSESMRRIAALEYRQAEIGLNRVKRRLEKRPLLDSLDMMVQSIRVEQREADLEAAERTLDLMTVTSPLDGIFVLETNRRTGQMLRLGDEVNVGGTVARIPDVRYMKVRGFVQENDISRIERGQRVEVRLDALPTVTFNGRLSYIGVVSVLRQDKMVFLTEVLIDESDLRLKPGMTVSCEYIIWESDEAVYVSSETIYEENNRYYLFVRRGRRVVKTEVEPGPSNNLYTVVSGKISPGDRVVLPTDMLIR